MQAVQEILQQLRTFYKTPKAKPIAITKLVFKEPDEEQCCGFLERFHILLISLISEAVDSPQLQKGYRSAFKPTKQSFISNSLLRRGVI